VRFISNKKVELSKNVHNHRISTANVVMSQLHGVVSFLHSSRSGNRKFCDKESRESSNFPLLCSLDQHSYQNLLFDSCLSNAYTGGSAFSGSDG